MAVADFIEFVVCCRLFLFLSCGCRCWWRSRTEHASNPAVTTDGADGGASSFNATTCRASGGKGGKRVQSNSLTVSTQANGGDGGVGNRTIAGGGATGGVAGTPSATGPGTPGTAGVDGTFFSNVGKGGGGGAGGVGKYGGVTCNAATAGGRGAYNPGDTSVYGPGIFQVMIRLAEQ